MIGRKDRTRRYLQLFNALFHDADRLLHLFDAAKIAVPAIAILPEDDIEVELVVAFIGLRTTQIPGDVGAAQHDAGETPVKGLFLGYDADINITLLEDAVFSDQ